MVPFAPTRFLLYSLYTLSHVIFVQGSDHHKMLGRAKRHETFPTLFYPGPDNKFIIMEPKKTQGNQNLQNVQQHLQHKKLVFPQHHQQNQQHLHPQQQQHQQPQLHQQQHQQPQLHQQQQHQQPQLHQQQHQQPQLHQQQHQQPQLHQQQQHQQPQLHQQQQHQQPQLHQQQHQQPQLHQQQHPQQHQQPMLQIISSQTWPAEATPTVMGVHGLYGQRITQAQREENLKNQVEHQTILNSKVNFQTPALKRPGEHQAHLNLNQNEMQVQQPVLDNFNQFDDGVNDQDDSEIIFGQKEILQHQNVQTNFQQQADHIQQQNPSLTAGHNLVQQSSGVTQDNVWQNNNNPQQFQHNLQSNTQQIPQEIHHQTAIVKPHHTQTSPAFSLQNNHDKIQQNAHGIAQSNENQRDENLQQIRHQLVKNTPVTTQSPTAVSINQVTERNQLFAHKFHFVSTSTEAPITATFRTSLEDVKLTLPGESGLLPFRGATIQTTTLEPTPLQNIASGSDNIDVMPQFQLPQSTAQPFMVQSDTEVPFEDDLGTPQAPETNFQCIYSTQPTYHADVETGCSTFHLCHDAQRFTFFCPPGTLFSQTYMICDWPTRVKCG